MVYNRLHYGRVNGIVNVATFRKLPSGKWNAQVRRKGHTPVSKTFRTRAAAEGWARKTENEIEAGESVDLSLTKITLSEILSRYELEVTEHKKGRIKERSVLKNLTTHLGALTLAQVTPESVAGYVRARMQPATGKGVSSDTIRRELATLSAVWETCRVLWGYSLRDNPARATGAMLSKSRQLKRKVRRDRRLHPGEYRRLLQQLQPTMRRLVRFAIETAMRRGEIAKLRPEHLRHDGLRIEDDKGGKTVTIPISSKARRIVEGLPTGGFCLRPDSITQAFDRACERAGIEDLRFHDLRHEGTSRLFEKGLGIEEVAMVTRHATWASLKGYTHPSRDRTAAKLG